MMRALPAVAIAASVVLVFAGCASAPRPLSSATDAEASEYTERARAQEWDWLENPDDRERPELPAIVWVEPEEWIERMQVCADEAGIGDVFGYGESRSGGVGETELDIADAEVANYLCQATYRVDPRRSGELLTTEQRDYLWGYYIEYLVPCLRANGATFRESGLPTREQFPEWGAWSPYYAIDPGNDPGAYDRYRTELERLSAICPAYPAGLPMMGLDMFG